LPTKLKEEEFPRTEIKPLEIGTVYLKDKNGNLVLVPGKTLEEISRALQARPTGDNSPPAYSFDRLQIRGKLEGNAAICEITLAIRLREPGWIKSPLRMEQAVLREAPTYDGPGEGLIVPSPDGAGYTAWLQGVNEKPHLLKFTAAIPVTHVGEESRLAITLPRATESSFIVETKHAASEAELRTGDGIVSTRSRSGGGSECEIVGGSGELLLLVRPVLNKTMSAAAALESTGEITVKVESQTRISADARLRVRGLGKPLESFRVRLPAGMEYVTSATSGYTATVVDATMSSATKPNATPVPQVVEVKLDRPSSGIVDVRLLAIFAADDRKPLTRFEPGRFEVLGANRQRGTLDLVVDGDWSLKWTEDGSTRRIDLTNEPTLAARVAARFEYFRQPCGLKLQVAPRATRINVEPTYLVHVSENAVRLEATLKYRLRGAKASAVAIELGNWKLARVGPENSVEATPPVEGAPRNFQFVGGQTSGDIEIQLEAWQELADGAEAVQFQLPRPIGDVVAPALLVVSPADNIGLTPELGEMQGLTAESSLPPTLKLPARQQPPLVYRDLSASAPAQFAAEVEVHQQRIAAGRRIRLNFLPEKVEVESLLLYRVSHVPARVFRFEIPSTQQLSDAQIFFAGQSLPMVAVEGEGGEPTPNLRQYQVSVPSDQLGPCEFTLKFTIPLPPFTAQEAHEIAIPLPRGIADDEVSGLGPELTVHYADPLALDLAHDDGSALTSQAIERTGTRDFRVPIGNDVRQIHWRVSRVDRLRAGALLVRKIWRQSWLSIGHRRDRVAFRLVATESPVRVQLPAGAQLAGLTMALDGQQVDDFAVDESGLAAVGIPEEKLGQESTLEVWYGLDIANGASRTNLVGAAISQAENPGETYWQVLLPEKEHLLFDPLGFTPDMHWIWQGLWWRRQSARTQRELETWCGASEQEDLPEVGNHLLFASFGSAEELSLRTVERRWLLLFASGSILAIGLALIHLPAARHPAWLLVVSIVGVALALEAPETGVLLGQAAGLGALCAVVALLWQFTFAHRPGWAQPELRPARTSDTRRKELAQRPAESSQAPTLPMGIAAPEPRP
jgi:hypothetical protein